MKAIDHNHHGVWERLGEALEFGLVTKLTGVFVLFAAFIGVGIGGYGFYLGRQALVSATIETLESSALEKEGAIKAWAGESQNYIRLISDLIENQYDTGSFAALEELTAHPGWQADIIPDLRFWASAVGGFSSLMLLDAVRGRVVISSDENDIGRFKENRAYFIEGLKSPGLHGPYFSITLQAPSLMASAPLYGRDGRVLAVVIGRVPLRQLNEIVTRRTGMNESDDAFLVNTSNLVVTQPRLVDDPAVLQRGIYTPPVSRCLSGSAVEHVGLDFQSTPVIAVYRWLIDRKLCLVNKVSQQEAFAPIRSLGYSLLGGVFLTLVLAGVLSLGLARKVIHPIKILQAGSTDVARGDLSIRLFHRSNDELGQLVTDFNSMTEALEARSRALIESEEQVRLLLNSTGEAIFGINNENVCTFVNPACVGVLGYKDQEDLLGREMPPLLFGSNVAEVGPSVAGQGPETMLVEGVVTRMVRRADGSSFPADYRSYPIVRKGRSVGTVVTFVDVTRRMRIEQEVLSLNRDLESRVEQRTEELREAQAELVHKGRLATLGQLTATVSHELRNPLGAMRTSTHVLRKVVADPPSAMSRSLDRLDRSITRCDTIIDELLDFTRMSRPERQPRALDPWLDELLDELPVPKDVTVERKLARHDHLVSFDPDRLRRVIINLYDNACQAVESASFEPGQGLIGVATRADDDRYEIVIEDNGSGIPDDIRERIFEPLFSTKSFGVGLGLSVVKQIIEQHHGGIEIESEVGHGSRFTVWLPRDERSSL